MKHDRDIYTALFITLCVLAMLAGAAFAICFIPPASAEMLVCVVSEGQYVNVRKAPRDDAGVWGKLHAGDEIDAKGVEDGFIRFVYGGSRAYVSVKLFEIPADCTYRVEAPVSPAAPRGVALVYAPTMQIPMDIRGTDNVYQAAKAAVCAAWRDFVHCRVEALPIPPLYMPLLGTGMGRMPLDAALYQIVRGIRAALRRWTAEDLTWAHAMDMHARWHQMTGVPESEPFPAADGAQVSRDGK